MKKSAEVVNNELVIRLDAEYLKRQFELGMTTHCYGDVEEGKESEMLNYFMNSINSEKDDSHFNSCVDLICSDAMEDGESFVLPETYD